MNRKQLEAQVAGAPRRFLRSFWRALTDGDTYNVRTNPSLWLGFLLAIPIPITIYMVDAPVAVKISSLFSPIIWSILLGAAGRVGIEAQEEKDRLHSIAERAQDEARHAVTDLKATEERLGQEAEKRIQLERTSEAMRQELTLAKAIQDTLSSPNISRPDCEVVIQSIPTHYIGGDYVHVNVVEDRWLYLCVGDVSGHGVAAALVVARIHGLIRRLTLTKKRPEAFLERLNRAAAHVFRETYFFMTFAVFRIDLTTGELEYATAGHPAQILLSHDGDIRELRTPNRLLGMDDDIFSSERPSDQLKLRPGDAIIMFTDGLFEILSDAQGEVLGENGLHDRIRSIGSLAPSLLIGEVLQDLAEYSGRSEFEDDVTLVAARWHGPAQVPAAKPNSEDGAS